MTKNAEITTRLRKAGAKELTQLRSQGFVPAIVYGPKSSPIMIAFDKKQARIMEEESEKASILGLVVEGEKVKRNVIVKDLQYDKLTDQLVHADLYEVDMASEIETEVPLNFVGVAPAVKELNGILVKNTEEVDVRCLPADLPEQIEVDISVLKTFDDMIQVKDLPVAKGVEIMNNAEEVIAMVSEPRSDQEMEALNEEVSADVSKVEGVQDKPKEEAGEAKEEAAEKKE